MLAASSGSEGPQPPMRQSRRMEQQLPAFRNRVDVTIEGRSDEEARRNLEEEWIDRIVGSLDVSLVIEGICEMEDPEPTRESGRDIPLYSARVTIAALTDSREQAEVAFSSLIGS